ncbi:MAG: AmmeMemoRadiSam system radical SAM enzyme [Candidatus Hatepunaea meridiana]|nr:AmmeMemoRadiSam system radical SAM enzyme [Candidatus Hatepunaea meridiana]
MNTNLTRREFLALSYRYGLLLGSASALLSSPPLFSWLFSSSIGSAEASDKLKELIRTAPRARFWASSTDAASNCALCHGQPMPFNSFDHGDDFIQCLLCSQNCVIKEGKRGKCNTRININGELRTLSYGRPVSVHVDPIEKKPFYHFLPGTAAFSLATAGCPLSCQFCQNWELSQAKPEDIPVKYVPPSDIVEASLNRYAPIIAYTYNEPTVFTEYLLDIARLGKKEGQRSVIISCGFMNEAPLSEMCEVLDGIKIDLKGFSNDFYQKVCGAELKPVLRSIKQVARSGVHLEIVNLVVPTLNDSDEMLNGLAEWIAGEVGPDIPVHFSRFHPDYKMLNLPPTPIATLERARDIALDKGLHYPFVGNVPGHPGNNTFCPKCGKTLIGRQGYFIRFNNVVNGKCKFCGEPIAGVWS